MELQKNIKLKNMSNDAGVVGRIMDENLDKKLDWYLQKFNKKDAQWNLALTLEKNKKGLFNWVLNITIDWKRFRYKREDYKKLDDLINHLFDHFKEKLASK